MEQLQFPWYSENSNTRSRHVNKPEPNDKLPHGKSEGFEKYWDNFRAEKRLKKHSSFITKKLRYYEKNIQGSGDLDSSRF